MCVHIMPVCGCGCVHWLLDVCFHLHCSIMIFIQTQISCLLQIACRMPMHMFIHTSICKEEGSLQEGMVKNTGCEWTLHANKYSGGYADGGYTVGGWTLSAAKEKCIELGPSVCAALTCDSSTDGCTVRASSSFQASSYETTYSPSASCFQTGHPR